MFALHSEQATQNYGSSLMRAFIWTILCGIPDDFDDKGEPCWSESHVYGDFGAFWAEYISRTTPILPALTTIR